MTDDKTAEICKAMGIEAINKDIIHKYPYWHLVYPTGDALLRALKEKLVEENCGFGTEWRNYTKHWTADIDKLVDEHGEPLYFHAATELDALLEACYAAFVDAAIGATGGNDEEGD